MFCPSCGAQSTEPVKFCKRCGTNLRRVKGVLSHGGGSSSSWIPEMMMAQAEIERQQGITPEVKRLNEVRGGVVTTFVGVGIMIFLYSFLGVIASIIHNPEVARLIDHIWLVGVIPFLIGVALTLNGLIIGKRIVQLQRDALQEDETGYNPAATMQAPMQTGVQGAIDAPTTSSFDKFSVTESTTTQLGERVAGKPQHQLPQAAQAAQPEQPKQEAPPGSQERSSTH
jgi:hypothetical protein